MQEVVGLMKNLSVHMMGGGRGQGYGYGHGYGSNEGFVGGRIRGMVGRGDMFQCYNCGEWGYKSPQCDKPKRMGGDIFPLPSQTPSCAQDYGIEIKGEAGPKGLTTEEKGKTKVVKIIQLDKGKDDLNAMVMPMEKRTTREQETSDAGPRKASKNKYRKADVTFGQLMEMCPRLKRQWKHMVNPMKTEPTKGSVRDLSLNKLPNICPSIDAWHKRKCIGEAYIDGGAQGAMFGHYQGLGGGGFDVKVLVNCHVMPAGIGAFPLILGRPWLQATKAIQDWGHGTITLYNRSCDKKKFDMATKQSLDADFDEDDDDEEYSSSEEDDGEESRLVNVQSLVFGLLVSRFRFKFVSGSSDLADLVHWTGLVSAGFGLWLVMDSAGSDRTGYWSVQVLVSGWLVLDSAAQSLVKRKLVLKFRSGSGYWSAQVLVSGWLVLDSAG
ncbi:hypothetical protein L7F22_049278 [Adiantum nelumboides]|nr:hypothetical protein [Adiantum nelumboides]